jgi:hypothetical protein
MLPLCTALQHNDLVDQPSPITSTNSNTRSTINTFGAANAFGEQLIAACFIGDVNKQYLQASVQHKSNALLCGTGSAIAGWTRGVATGDVESTGTKNASARLQVRLTL